MPGPAATVGSMHVCPMLNPGTPPPPHVGGPVSGSGIPTVLIGGKPAAVMGDMCTCMGPPDMIAQGEATVLIGGKPAATMGSMTAHGGSITQGEPTVLIGTGPSAATAVMAVRKIPFPTITPILKTLASVTGRRAQLNEAIENQEALREETEGDPKIYGVRWIVGEQMVRNSKVFNEVGIQAHVMNIPDGESITFSVKKPQEVTDEEGNTTAQEEDIIELTGTVQDKMVEVTWEVEKREEDESEAESPNPNSGEANTVSSGVATNNEATASNDNSESDKKIAVSLGYKKAKFTPLGLHTFKKKPQNGVFKFTFEIQHQDAEHLDLQILANGAAIYTETITDASNPILKQGKHEWEWDGFDSQDLLDTKQLRTVELQFKVTAKAKGEQAGKSVAFGPLRPVNSKWLDLTIDRASKKIEVDFRVHLKDGEAKGIDKHDKVPANELAKFGKPAMTNAVRSYTDLEQMVLKGIEYHFGRNSNHSEAKHTKIGNDLYQITVKASNTKEDSLDDIKVFLNTNQKWQRSGNPGSITDVISLFGNLVPERIAYNVGYIKYSNGWYYRDPNAEDIDFTYTAAHEIGHEIIKHFGGTAYSYGHKGTSTVITQKTKNNAPNYPTNGEIDLMKYFSNYMPESEMHRIAISEGDLLGILGSFKLK